MNAKEAYDKAIISDLDRIDAVIAAAAAAGDQETLYRSDKPYKSEVIKALEDDGYVLIKYAPTPMDRAEVYERASAYKYVLGISWYNAK